MTNISQEHLENNMDPASQSPFYVPKDNAETARSAWEAASQATRKLIDEAGDASVGLGQPTDCEDAGVAVLHDLAAQRPDSLRGYSHVMINLHTKLIDEIDIEKAEKLTREELRSEVTLRTETLLQNEDVVLGDLEAQLLIDIILDDILGFGPLEELLHDSTVNDILVNTYRQIVVERGGVLEQTAVQFMNEEHLLLIINKIVNGVGRFIDKDQPMVDARLPDGSRVNAVIPPLAVDGAQLSIRKFSEKPFDLHKLAEFGALPSRWIDLFKGVVAGKLNILISGGTGSGKTTLLNAMSAFISENERVITIEDAAELRLQQPQVVRLETRNADLHGRGAIGARELVKNALRMRPDRIIVGECRGGEAFDMLQAMNTGHEGSLTTIHANSCRDALSRVETLVGQAGMDISPLSIRKSIASAFDLVIQIERMSDGSRRVTSLSEIVGMEGDIITIQELFTFELSGLGEDGKVLGEFRASGIRPQFMERMARHGQVIPGDIFNPDIA